MNTEQEKTTDDCWELSEDQKEQIGLVLNDLMRKLDGAKENPLFVKLDVNFFTLLWMCFLGYEMTACLREKALASGYIEDGDKIDLWFKWTDSCIIMRREKKS